MDWFTKLEQRRNSVIFSVLLLMTAAIAVSSLRGPMSYDSFWHLKQGEDIVESGLSPWQDNYSYTFNGEGVTSAPVIFEVGLYGLVSWLGLEPAYIAYKFVCWMLIIFLSLIWLKRIKAPVLVYCLALPLLVAFIQGRPNVRPELLSYTFTVLSLILYERARFKATFRNLFPVALLMFLWTNYHSSIFGYVIFAGLFVDLAVTQVVNKSPASQWLKWFAWGMLIVAVGFMNPGFSHPVLAALAFPDEWKNFNLEYQSPFINLAAPTVYLLILAVVTLFMLWRQRLVGYFLVSAFLVFQACLMIRLITPAGIVLVCLFAYALSQADLKSIIAHATGAKSRVIAATMLVAFVVPLFTDVLVARFMVSQNPGLFGYFPANLVDYMRESGRSGRVFNDYEIGGYLIYHLSPDNQVYIDGRTNILYPLDFFLNFLMLPNSQEEFKKELIKYDVQHAVIRNTGENAQLIESTGLMKLDFADVRYFLYSRDHANFSLAGNLWGNPSCWEDTLADQINSEYYTALYLLPPASPLLPFLRFASGYTTAENKGTYLESHNTPEVWMDPFRRFAAFRSLDTNINELAFSQLGAVSKKELRDYLGQALAQLKLGRPDITEEILDRTVRIKWERVEFQELVILHALLDEIQKTKPLELFEESYIQNLANQVGDFGLKSILDMKSSEIFCPSNVN
ncbi:hypothetical protein ACFL1C_02965 [Pseudomonadota bacterium]